MRSGSTVFPRTLGNSCSTIDGRARKLWLCDEQRREDQCVREFSAPRKLVDGADWVALHDERLPGVGHARMDSRTALGEDHMESIGEYRRIWLQRPQKGEGARPKSRFLLQLPSCGGDWCFASFDDTTGQFEGRGIGAETELAHEQELVRVDPSDDHDPIGSLDSYPARSRGVARIFDFPLDCLKNLIVGTLKFSEFFPRLHHGGHFLAAI